MLKLGVDEILKLGVGVGDGVFDLDGVVDGDDISLFLYVYKYF